MTQAAVRAFVGLGSNQADPEAQVRQALSELDEVPLTRVVARSSLYRSPPLGPADQPDYINAVAALDTALPAADLLAALQALERRHGRVRGAERWGPRTLDLDLLLYGERRIATAELTVPHPGLPGRSFVLYPLYEIAPHASVPGMGPVAELLRRCPAAGLTRISAA